MTRAGAYPPGVSEGRGFSGLRVPTIAAAAALLLALAPPGAQAARWNWSGSGVLDDQRLYRVPDRGTLANRGSIVEWSLKATVDISEKTTVTARMCAGCHGLTVDQACAEVRFRPQVNLEAGRINVPFGDFYQRHDPASDVFMSKPLPYEMGHMIRFQQNHFNLGVLPMPYVDSGASLFGDVWIREKLQIWYGLYGVNGFRSGIPQDFNFIDQWSTTGWTDNNGDVSWGGRIAVAQGPVAVGGSYLRGAYDPQAEFGYDAWGVDGSVRLLGAQLRAEYLERSTDVAVGSDRRSLRKNGFYAQLEAPLRSYLAVVGRVDGLLREGPPLGTDNDETSGIFRWTLGVNVTPAIDYGFRAQYEKWRFTDFSDADVVHLGMVVTY